MMRSAPTSPRALDDVQSDTAQAEYGDVGPRFHLGRVHHGTEPGGHAAADVADLVERGVLADLGHRDLGQHREIGEGRRAHVVQDRLTALGEREVPSGIRPWPWVARMAPQRLVFPEVQNLHCRHSGV